MLVNSKEMIGEIQYSHGVFKIRFGYSKNGKCFKDQEAYENNKDAPCYCPESYFCDSEEIADNYYTHNQLLEICAFNEELCDAMFSILSWQTPETWIEELDSEDYNMFWSWLKVGGKAYWRITDWWEPDFYEVYSIENPNNLNFDTIVMLRREIPEDPGEFELIDARLWDLSKTDIPEKFI